MPSGSAIMELVVVSALVLHPMSDKSLTTNSGNPGLRIAWIFFTVTFDTLLVLHPGKLFSWNSLTGRACPARRTCDGSISKK